MTTSIASAATRLARTLSRTRSIAWRHHDFFCPAGTIATRSLSSVPRATREGVPSAPFVDSSGTPPPVDALTEMAPAIETDALPLASFAAEPSKIAESSPSPGSVTPVLNTEPGTVPAAGSEGTLEALSDGTAASKAEVLSAGATGLDAAPASTLEVAAVDAASADPAVLAQAAETAATTGFSLSDTLLQPAIMLLHATHDYTGLPWWLAIGAATFAVRTAILPLSIATMRNSARMGALQGEIAERREEVMEAMRSGDRSKAAEKQEAMKKFMTNAGVGVSKVLMGPLVQFPIFISFFVAVRRLALGDPSMATGGAAWFMDLSASDSTLMLPLISAASLAAMTELGSEGSTTKVTPMMKNVLRGMAVASVPLTYWFPAGVFCYWLPNNVYSVAFSLAMRVPSLKSALGMNIDLATIPGTKAFRNAAKNAALNPPISANDLSAASAAASYIKKIDPVATGTIDPVVNAAKSKPVLLKHRPKKKKKAHARN